MPCTNYKNPDVYFSMFFQTCVSNNGVNVDASIMPTEYAGLSDGSTTYWTMYLQRHDGDLYYNTIGTRTGYVNINSPSFRTFTNVKQNGGLDTLRLWVDFYEDSAKTKFITNHRLVFNR